MKKFGIGVDVGGTTVKIGIFENNGDIIEKWEIETRKENNGEFIILDIANSIKDKITKLALKYEEIDGIGIGVPGAVLKDGIVNKCVNLGWGIYDVRKELSQLLNGLNVKVANDANVAALGEMWKGGGEGFKNVVLITLGTGVGGGIIIDGKIISGAFGAGGEIGHMKMFDDEIEKCNCGKTGCLEQYASATGIVNQFKKILKENNSSKLNNFDKITAKDIFDYAKTGDETAIKAVELLGKTLGRALSYISCTIDPEVFVIGGGISKAGEILIEYTKKHYMDSAFHASKNTDFRLAKLGNDAGIYGAVKLVL